MITKKIFILIAALTVGLFPSQAFAIRGSVTLSQLSDQTGDITGSKVCAPSGAKNFAFSGVVTYNGGSSTLDAKIQYTIDEGTTWIDLSSGAFTQVTTSSDNEVIHVSNDLKHLGSFGCFRVVVDLGASGSPDYSWLYKLHYERD